MEKRDFWNSFKALQLKSRTVNDIAINLESTFTLQISFFYINMILIKHLNENPLSFRYNFLEAKTCQLFILGEYFREF